MVKETVMGFFRPADDAQGSTASEADVDDVAVEDDVADVDDDDGPDRPDLTDPT